MEAIINIPIVVMNRGATIAVRFIFVITLINIAETTMERRRVAQVSSQIALRMCCMRRLQCLRSKSSLGASDSISRRE